MVDWKDFADLKSYEKSGEMHQYSDVKHSYRGPDIEGLLVLNLYNIRFIEYAKRRFWQEKRPDDFIGMILRMSMEDVSKFRRSREVRKVFYIFPKNPSNYTHNTVDVFPEKSDAIKLIFKTESDLKDALASLARMKDRYEELKEKVKISDRPPCKRCNGDKFVPIAPNLIACGYCGQEYKL